jgi:tagatose-6-phosphate ketose/aldose isomerase
MFDEAAASDVSATFSTLADMLEQALASHAAHAATARLPARAVFVGSGPLAFAAREAALKVMELSAGQIPALWDSTLGFRHGPKSFVQDGTDIYIFKSTDAHTARYDDDLAEELRRQFPQATTTVSAFDPTLPDAWLAPLHVALAQILAVTWSAMLGISVDNPFEGKGTLSRVVSDVRMHAVNTR